MNILKQYQLEVEEWIHLDYLRFLGANKHYDLVYEFGISPIGLDEAGVYYITIGIEKAILNTSNGMVFFAKTTLTFKVGSDGETPEIDFLFNLIEVASFEFAKVFHQKTRNTNLLHHKIAKPLLADLKNDISRTLDSWENIIKNSR